MAALQGLVQGHTAHLDRRWQLERRRRPTTDSIGFQTAHEARQVFRNSAHTRVDRQLAYQASPSSKKAFQARSTTQWLRLPALVARFRSRPDPDPPPPSRTHRSCSVHPRVWVRGDHDRQAPGAERTAEATQGTEPWPEIEDAPRVIIEEPFFCCGPLQT